MMTSLRLSAKRAMRPAANALVVVALISSLVACSGSSRVRKPAELTPVVNQFDLQPVWSINVGSSETFNFHPVVAGDAVYAASNSGNLVKIDLSSGKKIWDVSVPGRLAVGPGSEDRKSTRLNSSHVKRSRMPSSA